MAESGDKPVRPRSKKTSSAALTTARTTISELEAELEAARKTIRVLMDKVERRAATRSPNHEVFEAAARMEQLVAQRTQQVQVKSNAFKAVNAELRALTSNLDQIVRQRTRALTESETQLRSKMAELERLNSMKAEFISIAAHELRTPLTSIVGYLDMMHEGKFGKLTGAMEKPTLSLRRNAHRLKRLVNEMLDVSRIEAGRVVLRRYPCELGDIVHAVVDELRPLAEAKDQTIEEDIRPARIEADADKIHQVASNLVANAIRYTPEGGAITAHVDVAPEAEYAGAWARLRVRDNGTGIPEGAHARIFEPFSDVHSAKHHTSSGPDSAGLGLYIARGLVDLHGGLITVESNVGEYTQFTVLLPSSSV